MIRKTVDVLQPAGMWRFLTPIDTIMPGDLICSPSADTTRDRLWEPVPDFGDPWNMVGKTLREARPTAYIVAIRACNEQSTWVVSPQSVEFSSEDDLDSFDEEYMATYREEHPDADID